MGVFSPNRRAGASLFRRAEGARAPVQGPQRALEVESQAQIEARKAVIDHEMLVVEFQNHVRGGVEVRANRPDTILIAGPQAVVARGAGQRNLSRGYHRTGRSLITRSHVVDLPPCER